MTQSKLQYMHPDDIVPYYNNPRHNPLGEIDRGKSRQAQRVV